jgi:hypothetical protein
MDSHDGLYSSYKHPFAYILAMVATAFGFATHYRELCFGIAFIAMFWVCAALIRENEIKKRTGMQPLLGLAFYKIAAIPALFMLWTGAMVATAIFTGR